MQSSFPILSSLLHLFFFSISIPLLDTPPFTTINSIAMADAELALVNKVDLRIALANSDAQLAAQLNVFLAPLLLKLASPHPAVKKKVIEICQHVNARIKST